MLLICGQRILLAAFLTALLKQDTRPALRGEGLASVLAAGQQGADRPLFGSASV